jgi:hypothetical protein
MPHRLTKTVRHNKTKCRKSGTREQNYFYPCCLCKSQYTFGPWTKARPPKGPVIGVFKKGGGRSWAPAMPPRGPTIDVSELGGGRSRTPRAARITNDKGPRSTCQTTWVKPSVTPEDNSKSPRKSCT